MAQETAGALIKLPNNELKRAQRNTMLAADSSPSKQSAITHSFPSNHGSVAQWLGRLPWDPEIPGSRPALTTRWICSWFNFPAALVNSQQVCLRPVGILNSCSCCVLLFRWLFQWPWKAPMASGQLSMQCTVFITKTNTSLLHKELMSPCTPFLFAHFFTTYGSGTTIATRVD